MGFYDTLGNLYAAQIYHTLRKAFPDYDHRLEHEGTGFILAWLQEHMYAVGQVYAPDDLARRLTGETLNPEYFVEYITKKYGAVYHLK